MRCFRSFSFWPTALLCCCKLLLFLHSRSLNDGRRSRNVFRFAAAGFTWIEEQKKKTNRIPTTDDDTAERDTLTQLTTHGGAAPCVPPVSTVDDCFICGGILVFFFVCQRPQNTVSDRCCCCCCCVGLLLRKPPSPPPHHGTIYYDEGELIPWLAAGCVCPALPLFTPSARHDSLSLSLALLFYVAPAHVFLLGRSHVEFITFIFTFSNLLSSSSRFCTPFFRRHPPRYFLLPPHTRVCGVPSPSFGCRVDTLHCHSAIRAESTHQIRTTTSKHRRNKTKPPYLYIHSAAARACNKNRKKAHD